MSSEKWSWSVLYFVTSTEKKKEKCATFKQCCANVFETILYVGGKETAQCDLKLFKRWTQIEM